VRTGTDGAGAASGAGGDSAPVGTDRSSGSLGTDHNSGSLGVDRNSASVGVDRDSGSAGVDRGAAQVGVDRHAARVGLYRHADQPGSDRQAAGTGMDHHAASVDIDGKPVLIGTTQDGGWRGIAPSATRSDAHRGVMTSKTARDEDFRQARLGSDAHVDHDEGCLELPLDQLQPNPYQPRHDPGDADIESLARSIRANGVIQPIVVRPRGDGYQIVAGERRWRAARRAGRATIPATIREATDEQMLELALIENLQREDLNAIDRARAYRRYCTHFGLTPEQVAAKMEEDRTTVVNYLRLLDLEDEIQERVASGAISMGHARCLLGIQSGHKRRNIVKAIVDHQLSVRATEEMVRKEKARSEAGAPAARPAVAHRSPHLQDVERRFEDVLKTKVYIKESRKKHRGRIVIEYYTLDDFDRIASALGVAVES